MIMAPHAWGWGREGHRLVAQVAGHHLNKKSQNEVARLLGTETLESIASWADEIRPQRRETSTWHYIDIPLNVERSDWHKWCPESGCIVQMIPLMESKLRNKSLSDAERAEALRFLVHFVGDMHQPLHVGENHDKGGNDVKVVYFNLASNLHSIWDSSLLDTAEQRNPQLKAKLGKAAGFSERRKYAKGTLEDWVWQSRDLSRDVVYASLSVERPAPVGDEYFAKANPVIQLQIRRAGVRLARLLNECLGD